MKSNDLGTNIDLTEGPSAELPKNMASIQYLRAVAAFLVILIHVGGAAAGRYHGWLLPDFVKAASMGVDIFFCVSGFIMYFTSGNDFGAPSAAKRFLLRRFLRVFPIYWLNEAAPRGASPESTS